MSKLGTRGRRRTRATLLCAAAILAAALTGCNTTARSSTPTWKMSGCAISRSRPPRTLEVCGGVNRGGLTPAQQADNLPSPT
jgi:hypothetical protein